MIGAGENQIAIIQAGKIAVSYVYAGARLVWQAINSCFGAGFWQSKKSWSRKDGWRRRPS